MTRRILEYVKLREDVDVAIVYAQLAWDRLSLEEKTMYEGMKTTIPSFAENREFESARGEQFASL